MRMIKVERMTQTVTLEGKTYGPSAGPISVPEELAAVLWLVPVPGEVVQVAAAPEQPADLTEALAERDRLKGSLERLYGLLGPVRQEGETPDVVLARVLSDRVGAADLQELLSSAEATAAENGRLLREALAAQDRAETSGRDLLTEISTLKGQLTGLTEARDEWQKRAETAEARPLLPADALERLKKVDGIGDKLGQKALDSLTAPAQSP